MVARGFGPPPVTAECGAPFLRVGGTLVVSEPPRRTSAGRSARWPTEGVMALGLRPAGTWQRPFHYQALEQAEPCPDRYPRRVGVPAKRPLF